MIEKIADGIYRIEIPLPRNPLKYTNSYLIGRFDGFLLVDTGMNRKECREALYTALRSLQIDFSKLSVFITHLHADHIGLAGEVGGEVFFSKTESEIVRKMLDDPSGYWETILETYIANGFPEREAKKMLRLHPGIRYTSMEKIEFSEVVDGDEIDVGGYLLKCIETPGHSPAHMCLYDEEGKLFFSGDHVLIDITPNITWWPFLDNSLGSYLESLEKVYNLDVNLVLPGHRRLWYDLRKRIDEIRRHHRARLVETLAALDRPKTAWEIAPSITWDLVYTDWEEVHVVQKWFAVGETIAHLEYLQKEGLVERDVENGLVKYFKSC
ncbi:MBL fold metallo-hydrolase [Archaeoglobus neptunius]|uniref:MBL fold metallo-hydrolase n=1 Tax=Archaeoglobus neptunius TaxID=2798580 RepID=UPI0019255EB8|nr:MBL fold metallo-hydrolase [Archaeoglobus neptunius]